MRELKYIKHMDTQLRFIQTVPCPDPAGQDGNFIATLNVVGVEIAVGEKVLGRVGWDRLEGEDVEYLADTFWMLQVWEFRAVVNLLARAKAAQRLVEI